MTQGELAAALKMAFRQCEARGYALTLAQQEILLEVMQSCDMNNSLDDGDPQPENPLDALNLAERQTLLDFIRDHQAEPESWKVRFMNDWLQGRDSGAVQFVRDRYGLQWLEQIRPEHIAAYVVTDEQLLKVGDRIEVANTLWEWIQDNDPDSRDWFACTIIQISDELAFNLADSGAAPDYRDIRCTVRFDNGAEFEIPGLYDWNRSNWRIPKTA